MLKNLVLTVALLGLAATDHGASVTPQAPQLATAPSTEDGVHALLTATTGAWVETCFKSGERIDGMSKLCYYKCTCGTKVLNLSSIDLCPLSAKFNC